MARNTYLSYWKKFFQAHKTEIIEEFQKKSSPRLDSAQIELESDFNTALKRYTYSTAKVKEWKKEKEIENLEVAVLLFQSAKDDFESALRSSITKWKYILGNC